MNIKIPKRTLSLATFPGSYEQLFSKLALAAIVIQDLQYNPEHKNPQRAFPSWLKQLGGPYQRSYCFDQMELACQHLYPTLLRVDGTLAPHSRPFL